MEPMETEKLIQKKPLKKPISESIPDLNENHTEPGTSTTTKTGRLSNLLLEPFQWLQMLSSQLNPSFIFGIIIVYGISQGFSGSFFKVVTDYYWKDVQKKNPSTVQLYMGFYYIPWIMKPVWGLLTDVFPIKGYKRRPYFVIAGVLGLISALVIALLVKLPVALALSCLIGVAAAMAIADVVIDACIARNSIEIRSLAPDIQSLCGFCSSAGALIGYATSGVFVDRLGAQGALCLLAIPPALIIVLGFFIYEIRYSNVNSEKTKKKKAVENLEIALKGMCKTIMYPQVWKPSLYMYLSLALSISTHEGQFYWYTDPKVGPAFSQEFVGLIYAVGALASIVGVLTYHKLLKGYPFRNLLFFAQLLYAISGTLDLIFILRWNLYLGIPNSFFVITEECVSRIISRIRWIPMIVLSTRLCPLGIEGAFFALLMCIDSFGHLSSKWGGGIVLHVFHVTRNDFRNLWLVILVRNVLRFSTLGLVFLVPKADHLDELIPSDILSKNELYTIDNDDDDDDGSFQLFAVNRENEVSFPVSSVM